MQAPAHFPTCEADLDEWSVYGDYLHALGDPRGELIAYELALPAHLDEAAVRAYHELARRVVRHRSTSPATFCLGHVRALSLLPAPGPRMGHEAQGPLEGTLANVRDFLQREGALLEELGFAYQAGEHGKAWRRVMAAVPAACTRMRLGIFAPITSAQLDELFAMLPLHVRELAITWIGRGYLRDPDVATALQCIDDRFERIDFSRVAIDSALHLHAICGKLARTQRVRLRLGAFVGAELPDRLELARPGDASLVRESSIVVLPRWSAAELQQQYGLIPVRTQLARRLAEGYGVYGSLSLLRVSLGGSDLVRRGNHWTVRGEVRHGGVAVPAGTIVDVAPGDRLGLGAGGDWTLRSDRQLSE